MMRLTAGIVTHNSEQCIARSLETLVAETGLGVLGKDWQIICLDNASKNRIELARLERKFPQVRFQKEERNLGFGAGHNRIMELFPAEFHAVLNPDVLFDASFLAHLLHALEMHPIEGSATGKLFRWVPGAREEKTRIIDSVGIGVTESHRFFDCGHGEGDRGQYETPCQRFGGTGAAVLYRRSALEDTAYRHGDTMEFFDATMFLYKEDIDLAYRLLTAGHPCLYVPGAIAWHARGVGRERRRTARPRATRAWSAAHEAILLRKHRGWWPASVRRRTALRQSLRSLYLLCCEPAVFCRARALLKNLKPETAKRMLTVKHTHAFAEIAHLFSR